ncbi:MAG: HNH endonuclease [Bacteroidota bacterium]
MTFNTELLRVELEQLNLLYIFDHVAHRKRVCIYCSQPFQRKCRKMKGTRDHIIPKKRVSEASAAFKNVFFQSLVVPCCFECNQLKGSKSVEEFRTFLLRHQVSNRIIILSNLKKLMA